MTMRCWIRHVVNPAVVLTIRRAPHRTRLGVSPLEDRCVPSTFTVNNVRDDGSAGTLRWAVAQANGASEASTINFDPGVFTGGQRIELQGGTGGGNGLLLSNTNSPVTIVGPSTRVWVEGPYDVGGHINHIFWINQNVQASFSNLVIAGGFDESPLSGGAGMHNDGTVNLTNCIFLANVALTAGGGLENLGRASLTNCRFSDNKAIENEVSPSVGGAISNQGTITLTSCTISGNMTTGNGGGLYNTFKANLTNCTVSGNTAGNSGGGLYSTAMVGGYNPNTTLNLTNCTVSGNTAYRGGGLYNTNGKVNLSNCNVTNNIASSYGGGVASLAGRVVLAKCTVSGNTASYGGGLHNSQESTTNIGTLILTDCTVSRNTASASGGGLYNQSILSLTNSTISDNVSNGNYFGGGLYNNGTLTLLNCTFNNNNAGNGGGLYNNDVATLTSCTFSNNDAAYGGGLFNNDYNLLLINTIVAGNIAHFGPDIWAYYHLTSHGYNLIGKSDGSSGWVSTDLTGTTAQPLDSMLAPLGNNGGPTQTMALRRPSPAINKGIRISGVVTDQRGFPLNSPPDIGAFQVQRQAPPPRVPSFSVGAGPGMEPRVNVYDGAGTLIRSFGAYESSFRGGVHVVTTDVNGDDIPDTITAPGFGGGPVVRVWDGATGSLVNEFNAYDPLFRGGVNIAVLRLLDSSGPPQIITGPGPGGGPHIKAFSTQSGAVLASFLAYDPSFTGGISVAATMATQGPGHIITGAGPGGGPHVRIFSSTGAPQGPGFMAYDLPFFGGVNVAALRNSDIITAPASGGGPVIREFSLTGHMNQQFLAYDAAFFGGVTLGVIPFGPDPGSAILTGVGSGGGPHVKQFEANHLSSPLHSFMAFDPSFTGGVFVG